MRKHKKPSPSFQRTNPNSETVQSALVQAENLLEQGRYQEILPLLEPLAARYPRVVEIHMLLGSAYVQMGALWDGAAHYERALTLRRDMNLLISLGFVYIELGLKVLALQSFRQAMKAGVKGPVAAQLPEGMRLLEDEILGTALLLGLPPDKTAKGLRLLEEGQLALHNHAYAHSIQLNRKAIQTLGSFPPPHNNLSLALFFHGEPDEAIRTARQVVVRYPDNIQALGNLVRFLAWTGRSDEAHQVWEQLKPLTPHEETTRMKMIEAAAIMDADDDVYRLVQGGPDDEVLDVGFSQREKLFLAVAEANTGRQKEAKRHLKALQEAIPWAGEILKALQAGQRGLGWAARFPYFHVGELLPQRELEAYIELVGRGDHMPEAKFRREIARFAARFPQLIFIAKKTLWEDQQVEAAIAFVKTLDVPEGYAVLKEFGLGQAGKDEARMQALFALVEAGQIPANEPVRMWQNGEWREVLLRKYNIVEQRALDYAPKVIDLLNEALLAFKENRNEEAENLYRRIITLEPRAKEAYNNLATLYARQDQHGEAKRFFEKALEIDPLYVMPRCNLATYLLGEGNIEEALALIAPLSDVMELHVQEMAFLSYIRARINIERKEYDQARNTLEAALEIYPDYEMVHDLLEHLDRLEMFERASAGWGRWHEQQHKRDLARRERQRTQLTTPNPTLNETLGLYTKEILTAVARLVIPWSGWSGLRKAELHQYLLDYFLEEGSRARLFEALTSEERKAFDRVLENGGTLAWEVFDQEFGNDLDESPYWQYHVPQTVMGRLRAHGLLGEVTVEGKLLVSIPIEFRRLERQ